MLRRVPWPTRAIFQAIGSLKRSGHGISLTHASAAAGQRRLGNHPGQPARRPLHAVVMRHIGAVLLPLLDDHTSVDHTACRLDRARTARAKDRYGTDHGPGIEK